MKQKGFVKRIAAWSLCMAMILTAVSLPVFTAEVKAAEESVDALAPSVTAFATKEDLVNPDNFTLHIDNGKGVAQKVDFGSDKTWYIAGKDKNGSLVHMCDPETSFGYKEFLAYDKFNSVSFRNGAEFKGLQVNVTHYGISDIRDYLNTEALNSFKEKEKELITNPVIYTVDARNSCTYTTSDKLYLAYGVYGRDTGMYITVGSNSSSGVNNGIKVGILSDNASKGSPYYTCNRFWLRSPDLNAGNQSYYGLVANGSTVNVGYLFYRESVVPVLNLDLSSVNFASTATVATSDATLSDAMTFRMDGKEVIKSKVERNYDSVKVTKGEASDEYIYIQYNDGETDQVISEKITADRTFNSSEYGLYTFVNCQIWIEKYDEESNLTYAVTEEGTNYVVDNKMVFEISEGSDGLEAKLVGPAHLTGNIVVKGAIEIDGQKIPVTSMTEALFRENVNITEL